MKTHDLKNALRAGPYAWPGGYPCYFITSDGCALSFEAVRYEFRQVLWSIRHNVNDGWNLEGLAINWEDPELYCEHTGKRIQSAYSEDETCD